VAEEKSAESIREQNRRAREEAAEKRRSRRETEKVAARRPTLGQLEASEIVDDALARTTHAVTGWLRRHFSIVQWVLVAGFAGGIGWQVYVHHRNKVEGRTTDALFAGVTAEFSRVGDAPAEDDPMSGIADSRPQHATDTERLRAAEGAYRKVTDGDAATALARFGLAGVLFDQGKYKEALAEYSAVRQSPFAVKDGDLRARAIEGAGLSNEALGKLDDAKKAFHELANSDSAPLSALGLYHQARLEKQEGATEKAKEHLKAALKKLADSKLPQSYVEGAARELLGSIDPAAVPPPSPQSLTPELRQQLEQLQQIEKLKKQAEETLKAAEGTTNTLSPDMLKKLGLDKNVVTLPAPSSGAAPASSAP
jgi:hypothetical protein